MKILTTPDPFLRHKAKPVAAVDPKTLKEIEEMFVILKASKDPQGVGLAATQVGLDKRLFILLDTDKKHASRFGGQVFINPKVTRVSKTMISDIYRDEDDRWMEGCLSMPKIWGFVDRPHQVTVEFQVPQLVTGNWQLITKRQRFSDIEAAYVQHEIDHLNGILFTDHILRQKGQIMQETRRGLVPLEA